MTKQKSPHTQSQQNTLPEQTDLEADEREFEANADQELYTNMDGAETGGNRTPRKIPGGRTRRTLAPETVAHEGSLETRTPKKPAQGITSRSAQEESARQEKVVKDRPDAQAGVNHTKRARKSS